MMDGYIVFLLGGLGDYTRLFVVTVCNAKVDALGNIYFSGSFGTLESFLDSIASTRL